MAEVEDLLAELRKETANKEVALTVLKLVKRDLESSLEEERRLSEEKLAALESQLEASTEENMRVEAWLTKSLKKEISANFRETQELIWRIESSFTRDVKLNVGRAIVKPVIFIPTDIQTLPELKDVLAVKRAFVLTQLWFQNQLGVTFNLQEPVVFKGEKDLKQYDSLTPNERISTIRYEIGSNENVVVFLYGSKDSWSWGSLWQRFALIGDEVYRLTIDSDAVQRYRGVGIVAHELGHVFELPHAENKQGLIMAADPIFSIEPFPLEKFTDREKEILRRNLTK